MKLKQIGSNMTELHLNNGTIVLFSYETPVAAVSPMNSIGVKGKDGFYSAFSVIKTNKKYSNTTTRHINKWFNYDNQHSPTQLYKAFNVKEVDQSVLDELVR